MALSMHANAQLASGRGAPYTPLQDQQVVEVLRERPLDATERQWRTLRQQARQAPTNVALATQVARQALQWARRDGDPRLLGQAQAALGHWWTQANPPAEVRLLRAMILQSTHDFDAALKDLRALTQSPAATAQAWLTQAAVQQVTGQYEAASASCEALGAVGAPWHQRACALELSSYRGQSDEAESPLAALASKAPRDLQPHINLIRAELAERQGRIPQANALYALLLSQNDDAYTEGAYADCLLDQQRPQEVIARLHNRQRNDALLLRLAEAYAALPDAASRRARDAAVQTLKARFAAARERGDDVHRREEARFTLRLLGQPKAALKMALANWQVQKEALDARILLEAAIAAGQPEAAREAKAFIRAAGWRDQRLAKLL